MVHFLNSRLMHRHHQHFHQHKHRQVEVITEVIQTVSIIQQVDPHGRTVTAQTLYPSDYPASLLSGLTSAIADLTSVAGEGGATIAAVASSLVAPLQTDAAPNVVTSSVPSVAAAAAPTASIPQLASSSLLPPAPSIPQSLPPTILSSSLTSTPSPMPTGSAPLSAANRTASAFPTTSVPSNSSAISAFGFGNRSITSTVLSESSTSETFPTTLLFPTSTEAFASSSTTAAISGGAGLLGFGSATGFSSTSTPTPGTDTTSASSKPSTPVVIGSVVGSLAGVALILFAVLYLVRWKKRRNTVLPLGDGDATTTRSFPEGMAPQGGMSDRGLPFAIPAALATLTGFRGNRGSANESIGASSTAGSERGFYRVSGRKIQSVLESGGDGYGSLPPDHSHMSETSLYNEADVSFGSRNTPSFMPSASHHDSGVPIMRPGPARTPVTTQGAFAGGLVPLTPPRRPDGVGRSHPSHDGSRGSRFTEEV